MYQTLESAVYKKNVIFEYLLMIFMKLISEILSHFIILIVLYPYFTY